LSSDACSIFTRNILFGVYRNESGGINLAVRGSIAYQLENTFVFYLISLVCVSATTYQLLKLC